MEIVAFGMAPFFPAGDGGGLIIGGRLGVGRDNGVSAGVDVTAGDGEMVGLGEAFFLFRCLGVGFGRTKIFLNFSPNDSPCSCVPRTRAGLIATVIAITST